MMATNGNKRKELLVIENKSINPDFWDCENEQHNYNELGKLREGIVVAKRNYLNKLYSLEALLTKELAHTDISTNISNCYKDIDFFTIKFFNGSLNIEMTMCITELPILSYDITQHNNSDKNEDIETNEKMFTLVEPVLKKLNFNVIRFNWQETITECNNNKQQ